MLQKRIVSSSRRSSPYRQQNTGSALSVTSGMFLTPASLGMVKEWGAVVQINSGGPQIGTGITLIKTWSSTRRCLPNCNSVHLKRKKRKEKKKTEKVIKKAETNLFAESPVLIRRRGPFFAEPVLMTPLPLIIRLRQQPCRVLICT